MSFDHNADTVLQHIRFRRGWEKLAEWAGRRSRTPDDLELIRSMLKKMETELAAIQDRQATGVPRVPLWVQRLHINPPTVSALYGED